MKRRSKTPVENEYAKQLRRIKRFIKRAENRGFQFDESVIPKKPKRVTQASVRKLQRITPEKIYKKGVYAGEDTFGEIIKADRYLKQRKKPKEVKTKKYKPLNISTDLHLFSRVIISNWYAMLKQFENGEAYNLLRTWMGGLIKDNGIDDVANMLEAAAKDGHILTWDIVYKTDRAVSYIGYILDYLPECGVFYKDEQLSKVDYLKLLGDALEQEEDWEYPL